MIKAFGPTLFVNPGSVPPPPPHLDAATAFQVYVFLLFFKSPFPPLFLFYFLSHLFHLFIFHSENYWGGGGRGIAGGQKILKDGGGDASIPHPLMP